MESADQTRAVVVGVCLLFSLAIGMVAGGGPAVMARWLDGDPAPLSTTPLAQRPATPSPTPSPMPSPMPSATPSATQRATRTPAPTATPRPTQPATATRASSTPSAPAAAPVTVRAQQRVNLRRVPNNISDETFIVTLAVGTEALALARTADSAWIQVRLDDGTVGWLSAPFLTLSRDAASLPVAAQ